MKRYFEGDEAARIGEVTQNIVMDFLRAQLIADAAVVALCPSGVLVTHSLATASARWMTPQSEAFVLVMQAKHDDPFCRIQQFDTNNQPVGVRAGRRHEWAFALQLSARNDVAARTALSDRATVDRKLADGVCRAISNSYRALQNLGVNETSIQADADGQANPQLINPHVLKCVTYTVEPIS